MYVLNDKPQQISTFTQIIPTIILGLKDNNVNQALKILENTTHRYTINFFWHEII